MRGPPGPGFLLVEGAFSTEEGAGEAERPSATHNVGFIHLDGHFADCICSFVEHLEETSATQCLGTHSTWQLQEQEGKVASYLLPLF